VDDYLFSIECVTCQRRLAVRDHSIIGDIVTCPKCGSMVHVVPPEGWVPRIKPPEAGAQRPVDRPCSDAVTRPQERPIPSTDVAGKRSGIRSTGAESRRVPEDASRAEAGARVSSKGRVLPRASPLPVQPAGASPPAPSPP